MKIKEYITIIEEIDGKTLRIKGQFAVTKNMKKGKYKNLIAGIALTNAKPGEAVMVQI